MRIRVSPEGIPQRFKTVYVKYFFEEIKSGSKTLELRIGFPVFQEIAVGDGITFQSETESVNVCVVAIRRYREMGTMRRSENMDKMAPGMTEERARFLAKQIFNQQKIEKHGLLVFEFEKIE